MCLCFSPFKRLLGKWMNFCSWVSTQVTYAALTTVPWIINTPLTSKDGKEQEHDWVEEAEPHGQSILVNDGRDYENREHGSSSEFPIWQLQGLESEQKEDLAKSSGVRLT